MPSSILAIVAIESECKINISNNIKCKWRLKQVEIREEWVKQMVKKKHKERSDLFTRVQTNKETYVYIEESTKDQVSFNPFLNQVITKIKPKSYLSQFGET